MQRFGSRLLRDVARVRNNGDDTDDSRPVANQNRCHDRNFGQRLVWIVLTLADFCHIFAQLRDKRSDEFSAGLIAFRGHDFT